MKEMNLIAKDNMSIIQRESDGYVNATKLCKQVGKEWKQYNRINSTKDFLNALSRSVQIPTDHLIKPVLTNVSNSEKGTYVHPKVAIHLAQWLSPEFAVFVSEVIFAYLSGHPMKMPRAMVVDPVNAALRMAEINEEVQRKAEESLKQFSLGNFLVSKTMSPFEPSSWELIYQICDDFKKIHGEIE